MIIKKGNKYYLYSHDGKKLLGKFETKKEALKREKQIIFFKNFKKS